MTEALLRLTTCGQRDSLIEREVELQHVDARFAQEAEPAPFGILIDQRLNLQPRLHRAAPPPARPDTAPPPG